MTYQEIKVQARRNNKLHFNFYVHDHLLKYKLYQHSTADIDQTATM